MKTEDSFVRYIHLRLRHLSTLLELYITLIFVSFIDDDDVLLANSDHGGQSQ